MTSATYLGVEPAQSDFSSARNEIRSPTSNVRMASLISTRVIPFGEDSVYDSLLVTCICLMFIL